MWTIESGRRSSSARRGPWAVAMSAQALTTSGSFSTTSVSVTVNIGGKGLHPGHGLSIFQLFYAAKMNLFDCALDGRCVHNPTSSFTTKF